MIDRSQELVKIDCANCGKSFTLTDFVYKARKKKSKNGDLCCSQSCAAQLVSRKKIMAQEKVEKSVSTEFVWEGEQHTVSGTPQAIAALKDLLKTFHDLEEAELGG